MPKKRKDGRYAKQITIGLKNGKPVRKTIYGDTLKELDKNYRDFMSLKDKGIILAGKDVTYREIHRLWIDNVKKGTLKPQTLKRYYERERFINTYLGDMKPINIQKSHIEKIRSDLISEKMYTKFNYILGDIRSVLQYAMEDGIVLRDVSASIKRLKYEPPKRRSLTLEERQLLEGADFTPIEKCFVYTLLYTGVRRNECLALTTDDINLKKRTIRICKTVVPSNLEKDVVQEMTKTNAGHRIIPISAPLLPVLHEYCQDKNGPIFLTPTGHYYRAKTFQKFWREIINKMVAANNNRSVAEDVTPHIFRHTYASDLYKAGIDIKQAQYLLGHTDITTTLDTYTHFGFLDVKLDKMEDYYNAVKKQSNGKIVPLKHA